MKIFPCRKCGKESGDVKGYVFKDVPFDHTYRSMNICVECRDNILGAIDELKKRNNENN